MVQDKDQIEPLAKKCKLETRKVKNINSVECVWHKIFKFLPCNFAKLTHVQKAWNLNYFAPLL